jgi:hypothetical protein
MYKFNEAGDIVPVAGVAGTPVAGKRIGYETGVGPVWEYPMETVMVAASDETTDLTTGTSKLTFRMPFAMTVTAVRANLVVASTSGVVTVDIVASLSSILSTLLTIDANEKTSVTAATPAVISDASLLDDEEIAIDIDTAGTGAKGLKVTLIGRRA